MGRSLGLGNLRSGDLIAGRIDLQRIEAPSTIFGFDA